MLKRGEKCWFFVMMNEPKMCWLLNCQQLCDGMKMRCVSTSWIHLGPAHKASEYSWTKALVLLSAYSRLCWGYPRKNTPAPLLALCSWPWALRLASGRSSRHSRRRQCPLGLRQEGSERKERCSWCHSLKQSVENCRQSGEKLIKMEINLSEWVKTWANRLLLDGKAGQHKNTLHILQYFYLYN